MKADDVFWHDCVIVRVVERPTESVAFHVDYPEDWENDRYVEKTIVFRDVFSYQIHEGPFDGPITILSATESAGHNGSRSIRLDTNAGFRELRFKTLELVGGHVAA